MCLPDTLFVMESEMESVKQGLGWNTINLF